MNTTENNIRETNVLIAEFMGYQTYKFRNLTFVFYSENNHRAESDLHYHDFWDWLMPVVEKIESLSSNQNVIDWSRQSKNIFDIKLTESKIEAVYKAVIEFIKWYNENSAKKE